MAPNVDPDTDSDDDRPDPAGHWTTLAIRRILELEESARMGQPVWAEMAARIQERHFLDIEE